MKLVHIINHSNVSNGGAQVVLQYLLSSTLMPADLLSIDEISLGGRCTIRPGLFKVLLRLLTISFFDRNAIFVVHHRFFLPFLFFIPRRVIFICHNIFPNRNWFYKYISKIRCVAVSCVVKNYLLYWNRNLNVEVIENGVSFDSYEVKVNSLDEARVLGYVGRLSHQKGVDLLVDAFSVIRYSGKNPKISLHLYGDGDLRDYLVQKVLSLGLSDSITFFGYHPKPFSMLTSADLIVIPSRFEGYGLVFYEALARGHKIVASNIDVFSNSDSGNSVVFFDLGSVDSLVEKILLSLSFSADQLPSGGTIRTVDDMVLDYVNYFNNFQT